MVGDIETHVDSTVQTGGQGNEDDHSSGHNTAHDTSVGSGNTSTDDHSSGHNVNVDRHDQTAGGNISDNHAQTTQTNFGSTTNINVGPGEEVVHHPDGSTSVEPIHHASSSSSHGGAPHHNYPRLHSHGPEVEHWKKQLNAVMGAQLPDNGNFDQDTHDWTVYFQQQNGLTPDGVVGPQTQDTMNSMYRPDMANQGGGAQGPYHPDTHGQYDPNQHGAFHPDTHGQFDPQMHGDFNPNVHGQFDPQIHGDFNPYVHGQFNPEYHGQFNPYVHGQFNPEYHGQYDPQIHGEFNAEFHGQYDPQLHGAYHPQTHGDYHPDRHGHFDENIHGRYDESLHGAHDPQIHGELSAY